MFSSSSHRGCLNVNQTWGVKGQRICEMEGGMMKYRRHCEERSDEAIQSSPLHGLLRGACHRAALGADPVARNDGKQQGYR
jgi:hypothetical protein